MCPPSVLVGFSFDKQMVQNKKVTHLYNTIQNLITTNAFKLAYQTAYKRPSREIRLETQNIVHKRKTRAPNFIGNIADSIWATVGIAGNNKVNKLDNEIQAEENRESEFIQTYNTFVNKTISEEGHLIDSLQTFFEHEQATRTSITDIILTSLYNKMGLTATFWDNDLFKWTTDINKDLEKLKNLLINPTHILYSAPYSTLIEFDAIPMDIRIKATQVYFHQRQNNKLTLQYSIKISRNTPYTLFRVTTIPYGSVNTS
jgi:hypothetical protein